LDTRNKRSVWTVPTQGFKGAHFATFPPDLIRPCILAGAPLGGIVLDPFGGAGTTAVVAMEEGRKSILCELNPEYAAMAERRIASARLDGAAQMDVFRDTVQHPAA
jgi:DNA modification methylase